MPRMIWEGRGGAGGESIGRWSLKDVRLLVEPLLWRGDGEGWVEEAARECTRISFDHDGCYVFGSPGVIVVYRNGGKVSEMADGRVAVMVGAMKERLGPRESVVYDVENGGSMARYLLRRLNPDHLNRDCARPVATELRDAGWGESFERWVWRVTKGRWEGGEGGW